MALPGWHAESALNLAVLRVVVPLIVLISPELWHAPQHASRPLELRVVPEGLAAAARLLPSDPESAQLVQLVLIAACVLACFGLASRLAMGVVTLAGLYVFGLAQLSGSVLHDMHLFWFAALLAASPCGDALSIDAWLQRRRGRPAPAASLAYGVPLQGVRVLLGVIYFFPGFWKLRSSGLAWIFSANVENQMYWKWYQHGVLPALRPDDLPWLLQLGALLVVVFELSFITLIWSRRTRLIAAGAGLAFHAATELLLYIPFVSLWACYVVLIDWSHGLATLRRRRVAGSGARHDGPLAAGDHPARWVPAALLATALIAASVVQGARGAMQAWPVACYPTFQWLVSDMIPDLRLEAVLPDGSTRAIPDGPGSGGQRAPAAWASAWHAAGLYGTGPSQRELRAYWDALRLEPPAAAAASGAKSLRFYLAHYSVRPERWGAPPLRKRLLFELMLD
jgi:hypothetical protein